GDKTSNELEWIKTLFDKLDVDEFIKSGKTLKVKKGNASLINKEYLTSVEYNNLSTFLLRISDDKYTILFNQRTLGKELENFAGVSKIEYDSTNRFPIGYNESKSRILVVDNRDLKVYELGNKSEIDTGKNLTDFTMDIFKDNLEFEEVERKISRNVKANARLAYSRVKITNKLVPIIVLLGFTNGLKDILERYNVDYYFTEKNEI